MARANDILVLRSVNASLPAPIELQTLADCLTGKAPIEPWLGALTALFCETPVRAVETLAADHGIDLRSVDRVYRRVSELSVRALPMSTTGSDTYVPLLRSALVLLDGLTSRGFTVGEWTFGGGTVLMLRYQHRLSRDVDIFLTDAQLLPALSPRLNDAAADLTDSYDESSSSLKFALDEGEIDFIVAPRLLPTAPATIDFEGRAIPVDGPAEIVAKQLFYRPVSLKVRDLVDLAVVLDNEPDAASLLRPILTGRQDALRRRVEALRHTFSERVANEVALLPAGEPLAATAWERTRAFVAALAGADAS